MPRVSVVVPAYNCVDWVAESVQSVLDQLPDDGELVIIDDGSTDGTADVLARFTGPARVVRVPHGGLAHARNAGLAHAQGEWIAFHDADDVAVEGRLARQWAAVTGLPGCEGVFGNGGRIAAGGAYLGPVIGPALARRCVGRPLTAREVFLGFPVFFQASLVRRDLFSRIGEFDSTLRIYPDHDYGFRLVAGGRVCFVDDDVFRYRQHATNITRDRLGGREELARILERVLSDDPGGVARIGRRHLLARLTRHYRRIADQRSGRGDHAAAREAVERALALRPLDPRSWLARLRAAMRAADRPQTRS